MSDMTNTEIAAEFEELFGNSEGQPDEEPTEDQTSDDETASDEGAEESTEETTEETGEDNTSDEEGDESSEEEPEAQPETKSPAKTQTSKQNHAFAEQRLQIKKQEEFIRGIGKLIGFEDGASLEDIQEKVKDVLLEKEAKENNIPIDIMKRLDRAEELLQENDRIKLEKKVTEDFSELIDEHNLDETQVKEFTNYLIENGKNPMLDPSIDLSAEYLKLHYKDMVTQAVKDALAKEEKRKDKVEDKAASAVTKAASDKDEVKIDSVSALDDAFADIDL